MYNPRFSVFISFYQTLSRPRCFYFLCENFWYEFYSIRQSDNAVWCGYASFSHNRSTSTPISPTLLKKILVESLSNKHIMIHARVLSWVKERGKRNDSPKAFIVLFIAWNEINTKDVLQWRQWFFRCRCCFYANQIPIQNFMLWLIWVEFWFLFLCANWKSIKLRE